MNGRTGRGTPEDKDFVNTGARSPRYFVIFVLLNACIHYMRRSTFTARRKFVAGVLEKYRAETSSRCLAKNPDTVRYFVSPSGKRGLLRARAHAGRGGVFIAMRERYRRAVRNSSCAPRDRRFAQLSVRKESKKKATPG